ncbi:hypothetical protein COU37_03685 [Candidatus Micrarchaeota archaeon CG10_big_fil_rev_8_21_14_0_10_45_29]|nr:MAG: hypothetical protein COU37_03685 [Candidatus Micrarchaeota archaeon CG10_big_fil_rev_8_21_14_0_10_45_29]
MASFKKIIKSKSLKTAPTQQKAYQAKKGGFIIKNKQVKVKLKKDLKNMRLITHTDLDGVMCAALITCVEQIDVIKFVDPGTIQAKKMHITKEDIIADLPFDSRAGMYFDHHEAGKPDKEFVGKFEVAPSAARVVYDYYENPYLEKFLPALEETDRIDSGRVKREEVREPKGWFLLSNTFEMAEEKSEDDAYRKFVVKLLRREQDIEKILDVERVKERAEQVLDNFEVFSRMLKENTKMIGKVAFSDFRGVSGLPKGNNFLVYSLFPQAITSVRIMPEREGKDFVKISAGHNIYGKKCELNVGEMMKKYGGGGHRAVGGASLPKEIAEEAAMEMVAKINKFEEAEENGK